ncbi:CheF family chemotaxis protein [Natronobacterium gregoryi]|uniref:Fla operon protein n=2 Tax=Natronobacterium gregoryi TaxID=44930 RepID=L0AI82_NATGS|nr:CheF family chemotaxis protein [Natronobacterium gregoryi]AFZ73134.1 hypothetical protein Natgr_1951 [Natronobacterium gregoryi SP2]ELY70771.1 hypothetical protein C490_05747 [Natronobacterium gregoryi SP2]PLK21545.1 fla operon protein [Natronobacterium gregoryi SP2]SFI60487.1 HTH domain-containing protein [Natronobacterium gregoryi]
MSEDIVADITCRFFLSKKRGDGKPVKGRIILTERRMVLASAAEKKTIPLSRVVDVNVGSVPYQVKSFFDDTVTVAYKGSERTQTAIIESEDENVEKLTSILFRLLLNDRKVAIQHPTRIDGRRRDAPVVLGELSVVSQQIVVQTQNRSVCIDVANITQLDQANRIGDDDRTTLVVTHINDETGQAITSLIAPARSQHVNLLARYIHLGLDELREEIENIQLSKPEKRLLVNLHSTGGELDFRNVLDGDPAYVTNVLHSVRRKNLIVETGNDISLTARGRIVVSEQIGA